MLLAFPLLAACSGTPEAAFPGGPPPDFGVAYAAAFQAEALDPTAASPYLDLVDFAVANPEAPGAFPAGIAAVGVAVSLAWEAEIVAAFGLIGAMIVPATLVFQGGLQEIGTAAE